MRARARRSEETAERIREAALGLFVSRPYDEVTLAGIAEAAGVTVPTLIAHFGRKEDLLAAAWREGAARVVEMRDEAPTGDSKGAIRVLIDSYEAHGEEVLFLLAEEDRFPTVRVITDYGRSYHRSWVERVFEPSLQSLRGVDREQLVVQLTVATDLVAWKVLRLDMDLSRIRTEAAMLATVEALAGTG